MYVRVVGYASRGDPGETKATTPLLFRPTIGDCGRVEYCPSSPPGRNSWVTTDSGAIWLSIYYSGRDNSVRRTATAAQAVRLLSSRLLL